MATLRVAIFFGVFIYTDNNFNKNRKMGKLNTIWEKIKKWFKETALPWAKKGAIQIINVIVVFFLYGQFDNLLQGQEIHLGLVTTIAGLWAFVLAGYWLFWKLLGADKVVKSLIAQWKKKHKK